MESIYLSEDVLRIVNHVNILVVHPESLDATCSYVIISAAVVNKHSHNVIDWMRI